MKQHCLGKKTYDKKTIITFMNLQKRRFGNNWKIRKLLHLFGIHFYSKTSSRCCGDVAHIHALQDWQKYNYKYCFLCAKEMPHSRYFFNIGVREKNAEE